MRGPTQGKAGDQPEHKDREDNRCSGLTARTARPLSIYELAAILSWLAEHHDGHAAVGGARGEAAGAWGDER